MAKTSNDTVRRTIKAAFMKAGGVGTVLTVAEVLEAAGPGIPTEVAVQSYMTAKVIRRVEDMDPDQRARRAAKGLGLGKDGKLPPAGSNAWDMLVRSNRTKINKFLARVSPQIAEQATIRDAEIQAEPLKEKVRFGRHRLVSRCLSDMAYEQEVKCLGGKDDERSYKLEREFPAALEPRRPKKVKPAKAKVAAMEVSQPAADLSAEVPVKRKRGRPRKVPVPA